jgi:predicted SnoaL-like aldol condensation-catalyzing enzyme
MSVEENRAALLRFYDAINRRDFEEALGLLVEDHVNHNRDREQAPGARGVVATFRMLVGMMPDLRISPVNVLAERELVAAHLRLAGTHTGGRAIAVTMTEIVRFSDGKMVERWGNHDEVKLLRDLGVSS